MAWGSQSRCLLPGALPDLLRMHLTHVTSSVSVAFCTLSSVRADVLLILLAEHRIDEALDAEDGGMGIGCGQIEGERVEGERVEGERAG